MVGSEAKADSPSERFWAILDGTSSGGCSWSSQPPKKPVSLAPRQVWGFPRIPERQPPTPSVRGCEALTGTPNLHRMKDFWLRAPAFPELPESPLAAKAFDVRPHRWAGDRCVIVVATTDLRREPKNHETRANWTLRRILAQSHFNITSFPTRLNAIALYGTFRSPIGHRICFRILLY